MIWIVFALETMAGKSSIHLFCKISRKEALDPKEQRKNNKFWYQKTDSITVQCPTWKSQMVYYHPDLFHLDYYFDSTLEVNFRVIE